MSENIRLTLNPTIGISELAKIIGVSRQSIVLELGPDKFVPGTYKNSTGWQIGKGQINQKPFSEMPRRRGVKKKPINP